MRGRYRLLVEPNDGWRGNLFLTASDPTSELGTVETPPFYSLLVVIWVRVEIFCRVLFNARLRPHAPFRLRDDYFAERCDRRKITSRRDSTNLRQPWNNRGGMEALLILNPSSYHHHLYT